MFLSCHVCVSEWIHTYSCLNVKEPLARSRREFWSLSDSNWTRTHNYLVHKRTLNHSAKWLRVAYELSGCGFESSCSHLITFWPWCFKTASSLKKYLFFLSFYLFYLFVLQKVKEAWIPWFPWFHPLYPVLIIVITLATN